MAPVVVVISACEGPSATTPFGSPGSFGDRGTRSQFFPPSCSSAVDMTFGHVKRAEFSRRHANPSHLRMKQYRRFPDYPSFIVLKGNLLETIVDFFLGIEVRKRARKPVFAAVGRLQKGALTSVGGIATFRRRSLECGTRSGAADGNQGGKICDIGMISMHARSITLAPTT